MCQEAMQLFCFGLACGVVRGFDGRHARAGRVAVCFEAADWRGGGGGAAGVRDEPNFVYN